MHVVFLILALLCVALLAVWVYGAATIGSGIFVKAQCRVDPSDGILLTFDDGPDPDVTPRVLDVLDRHHQKALFFVIGSKAEAHPEVLREIVRRGHRVGNHTFSHSPYANFLGSRHLEREIRMTDDAIERACGIRPTLFRPPLGISTHFMRGVLRRTGHSVVGWSVRSFDTRPEPREKVLRRIVRNLRGGDIVLLHDRLPGADWLADEVLDWWENNNSPRP